MTSAKTYAKALRYIRAGKVTLRYENHDIVVAAVEGETGNWIVYGDDNGWYCACPSRTTCSHIIAVEAWMRHPLT